MTSEQFDSLVGIFAYDVGCVSSGIHDELLRDKLRRALVEIPADRFRIDMSRYIRDEFLSEERLEQGYGIEDVAKFIKWLDQRMGCSI